MEFRFFVFCFRGFLIVVLKYLKFVVVVEVVNWNIGFIFSMDLRNSGKKREKEGERFVFYVNN